jgi:hypothetical protein
MGCFETSVTKYRYTLRNITGERRSLLHSWLMRVFYVSVCVYGICGGSYYGWWRTDRVDSVYINVERKCRGLLAYFGAKLCIE